MVTGYHPGLIGQSIMPRKFLEPRSRVEIWLPETLKARLDLACLDPVRGKPDYGKRSALVQQLLNDYFNKQALEIKHEPASPLAGTSADPANFILGGSSDPNG